MRRSASRVMPPLLCACRDGILPRMSQSDVPAYTKRDGTRVGGHIRRNSAAEPDVDDDAKQAAVAAAQQAAPPVLPPESLASNYIAEELSAFDLNDEDMDKDWGNACDEYLRHQALLEQLPDSHPSVGLFRLKRMENALEKMYENDGGKYLPYEFYAEGIVHFEDEVQSADYDAASADDPSAEGIPAGESGTVPYGEFEQSDIDSFFDESAAFLSRYNGEGVESDAWCAARQTYLSCLQVYESADTHDAHAQFCVHRAQLAFREMDQEFQKSGDKNEAADEFYGLGERRLVDLEEAAAYATASAPTQSEADRWALRRLEQGDN